jgi:hypothetical protein
VQVADRRGGLLVGALDPGMPGLQEEGVDEAFLDAVLAVEASEGSFESARPSRRAHASAHVDDALVIRDADLAFHALEEVFGASSRMDGHISRTTQGLIAQARQIQDFRKRAASGDSE